eukprot:scaffold2079_cov66-Cyclotella_meneghiniana.AAC.1
MPTLSLRDSVGGTVAENEEEHAQRLCQMQIDEANRRVEQNAHLPASVAFGTRDVSIYFPGHANGYELMRKLNEHYTRIGQLSKTGRYFEEIRELTRQCSSTR